MSEKKLQNLKHWQENKKRNGISCVIHECDKEQIKFLCECALNISNRNIAMNVNKLMPFEQQLKILCQLQTSDRRRRQILSSIKSYKLFKLISRPLHLLFISRMSAQKFILKSKKYIKNQPKASEILADATITAKSKQLTLLQRVPEKGAREGKNV